MICTRHSTNLASSRNVEGENASLQVDMPHSKTPLLKLPNTELGSLVPSLRTADVFCGRRSDDRKYVYGSQARNKVAAILNYCTFRWVMKVVHLHAWIVVDWVIRIPVNADNGLCSLAQSTDSHRTLTSVAKPLTFLKPVCC